MDNENVRLWNDFWGNTQEEADDVEGLIWRKDDGTWTMLAGVPMEVGRVINISVQYNPFTGEKLE